LKSFRFIHNVSIKKLVDNSEVMVHWESSSDGYELQIKTSIVEDHEGVFEIEQLSKFKDEAYLIRSKTEEYENAIEK
jgi:hypothetical protein